MNDKKFYLEHIAKRWNQKDSKKILYELINHDATIFAPISNVTFRSKTTGLFFEGVSATDMPIPESYLQIIYSKGFWTGKTVLIKDSIDGKMDITEVAFDNEMNIGIGDLYLYEKELIRVEQTIDMTEKEASKIEYNNLLKLIWVMKDMLLDDGKARNYNFIMKRKFNSAALLISQIEEYSLSGLGKRNLEKHFSKANEIIEPLKKNFIKK